MKTHIGIDYAMSNVFNVNLGYMAATGMLKISITAGRRFAARD